MPEGGASFAGEDDVLGWDDGFEPDDPSFAFAIGVSGVTDDGFAIGGDVDDVADFPIAHLGLQAVSCEEVVEWVDVVVLIPEDVDAAALADDG